jgi:hypothetical protein
MSPPATQIGFINSSNCCTSLNSIFMHLSVYQRGARWSSGQCARRAIAEAKHRSQWPALGWVTKIYYLELLRASEGTLSRWSRLHLQSLAPTPVSRRVDVRQAAGRKNNCRIFLRPATQHDEKHIVPTPLSGIRVGGRRIGIPKIINTRTKCAQSTARHVKHLQFNISA